MLSVVSSFPRSEHETRLLVDFVAHPLHVFVRPPHVFVPVLLARRLPLHVFALVLPSPLVLPYLPSGLPQLMCLPNIVITFSPITTLLYTMSLRRESEFARLEQLLREADERAEQERRRAEDEQRNRKEADGNMNGSDGPPC
jgi:hypothetical protein